MPTEIKNKGGRPKAIILAPDVHRALFVRRAETQVSVQQQVDTILRHHLRDVLSPSQASRVPQHTP